MSGNTLNLAQLKQVREKIYFTKIYKTPHMSKSAALKFLQSWNGKIFDIPNAATIREKNFQEFVKNNFAKHDEFASGTRWPDKLIGFSPYETLKCYAKTDYGAMMIKRVLMDNLTGGRRFEVTLRGSGAAEGNENHIFLPENFGTMNCNAAHGYQFGGDGQKIDYPAIIHHEFRHTKYFGKKLAQTVSLRDERDAVLYNENPARVINGYEPRYSYYDGSRTINIITGEVVAGKYGVKADDPTEFIKRGTKGSLTNP